MKLSSLTLFAAGALLLAGCSSLDNPFAGLFHGVGHDERVYNPQTGQWEWPADKRTSKEKKSALAATPAPHGFNDTRYWDPKRNQWVEQEEKLSSASKSKATPAPATPVARVAPTPPPPRGSRTTGVYNASTGKIEWQGSGEYVPSAPAPTPAPKKRWWWPL